MFVQQNTLNATKRYFSNKLNEKFNESEIRYMFQLLSEERLKLSRTEFLLKGEDRLSESDLLYFRTAAHKLLEDIPFQHILGYTYFFDLKIKCDARALVPRPETEELVYWILEDYANPISVLDICTGTGCIALAVQANRPNALVEGWDLSQAALDLAMENKQALNLNVKFAIEDALTQTLDEGKWDVIVSNPPYIPNAEKQQMDKTVTDYDPAMALFVPDNDPLMFYRAIGKMALKGLRTGGALYFELHESFGKETMDLLGEMGFEATIKKDMQGKDRMLKAVVTQVGQTI